ncbi:hypothetical protein F3Y22_tig00112738pilonHSYRG00147 [Hibiscus syriacus]|uniref:Uncharacterized protein n=1 Tax=Hibiscus syriacus TaxID=106335 RepID=A0A6A2X6S8_HIBSY|nr:hypothetical protein F3Y22_tig00112738pilonHSYRG00147 [Hibiscus syriacus]
MLFSLEDLGLSRCICRGQISCVQALLEELPGQFLTYVRSRNIKPLYA